MVAVGSGGSAGSSQFIRESMPLVHGLQFVRIYWELRDVETLPLLSDRKSADMVTV
jgi:hypothetical protein